MAGAGIVSQSEARRDVVAVLLFETFLEAGEAAEVQDRGDHPHRQWSTVFTGEVLGELYFRTILVPLNFA